MEEFYCVKCGGMTTVEGAKKICLICGHVEITLTVQDGISGQESEFSQGEEDHGKV